MRKRTSFTRICRPPRMVPVLRFNPPQSGCFPASKFDTRENPKRGGLNCGGFSIGVVCPRSIDVDVRSAVSAPSRTATGIGNDLERSDPRHRTAIRAPKFAGYVRRPNITGTGEVAKGWSGVGWSGALWSEGNIYGRSSSSWDGAFNMYLDASRSSSLFGRSTTVQPQSVRLLPCIKL